MARWFVFVDTDYYPYVDDVIEADTLEEAREKAPKPECGERIYLAREEDTTILDGGQRPPIKGSLAVLQDEANRRMGEMLEAKNELGLGL